VKRLAIIAHDNKKVDLVAWATFNRETLSRFSLTATRHIARLLERKIDPLAAQPHEPDIRALLRVCNVHNVPLATNLATADLIITAFGLLDELPVAPELAL
jgi:methylglyoxal synthase